MDCWTRAVSLTCRGPGPQTVVPMAGGGDFAGRQESMFLKSSAAGLAAQDSNISTTSNSSKLSCLFLRSDPDVATQMN